MSGSKRKKVLPQDNSIQTGILDELAVQHSNIFLKGPEQGINEDFEPLNDDDILEEPSLVQSEVLNILSAKNSINSLLKLGKEPGIKELPDNYRVIKIDYPLLEQSRIIQMIDQSDLGRTLSLYPTIRSPQEKIGSMQLLVTNPSSLGHLKARAKKEDLHFSSSITAPNAEVIHLNGAAAILNRDLYTCIPRPGLSLPPSKKLEPLVPWPETAGEPEMIALPSTRLGPCSYFLFDLTHLDQSSHRTKILDQLSVIAKSPDVRCSFDQMGNLVVVALTEKTVGRLSLWADALRKISDGRTNLFLGKGTIKIANNEDFVVDGFLTRPLINTLQDTGSKRPSIYTSAKTGQEVKGSRDETLAKWQLGEEINGLTTVEIKKETNLNAGSGPDRLIGYQEERAGVEDFLSTRNKKKLLFVEASAGMGKSRLVSESIKGIPKTLKISIDPAGRNIAGFSLIDFADQLINFVRDSIDCPKTELPPSVTKLIEFVEKEENERLLEANQFSQTIAFYCTRTLQFLEEQKFVEDQGGFFPIIIDDAHHIDRHSDSFIMQIIADALQSDFAKSKVVLMRRPEERYVSASQDNLRRTISEKENISLHYKDAQSQLKPKLDLSQPQLAYEYIFYSLPGSLRINPENGLNRELGAWAESLGSLALSPWEMTTFLQEIINNAEDYLLVQKDRIELSEKGARKIIGFQGKEMIVCHLERISEELSAETLQVLQSIALIGRKLSDREQLIPFLVTALGCTEEDAKNRLFELEKKGYLIKKEKISSKSSSVIINQTTYAIWHENVRDIVLNYTMDEPSRAALAAKVYYAANKSNLISDKQKFTILHYAAGSQPLEDQYFWQEYTTWGSHTLKESSLLDLYSQGFATASLILNDLKLDPDSPSTINQVLNSLLTGKSKINSPLSVLILYSLYSIIENGYFTRQFPQVYQAIEMVEKIKAANPDFPINLQQLYLIGFNTSYVNIDRQQFEYYYQHLDWDKLAKEDPKNGKKIFTDTKESIDLKYNYRRENFKYCLQVINEWRENRKTISPEMDRLMLNIETQVLISSASKVTFDVKTGASSPTGTKSLPQDQVPSPGTKSLPPEPSPSYNLDLQPLCIDGDIVMSGQNFPPEYQDLLSHLRQGVKKIKDLVEKNSQAGPASKLRWTLIEESSLLKIEASLAALSQEYHSAIKILGEAWRAAMQIGNPYDAANAAKIKGDIEVINSMSALDSPEGIFVQRQNLRSAIHTYTEEGHSIPKLNNNWKILFACQRLRAIGMFLFTFSNPQEGGLNKEDLDLYFQMADEDVSFINQKPWTDYLPDPSSLLEDISQYEFSYYVSPLILNYKHLCRCYDHQSVLLEESPYEKENIIRGSRAYAERLTDDHFGERNRKIDAMDLHLVGFNSTTSPSPISKVESIPPTLKSSLLQPPIPDMGEVLGFTKDFEEALQEALEKKEE